MKKIILVEDDAGISASLKLYLENSDFVVKIFETGVGAREFIFSESPDLVILDINLPGENGVEICKKIREVSALPIIMLTARGSETDRITGLEIGADDYISKPFSPRELLARIHSILRRLSEDPEDLDILSFGNIKINTGRNEILVDERVIQVTKNEYEIFLKIAGAKGALVSRETLMKEVIGYDNYVYDRTIDTHIKNLRKKINNKDFIITVRGKGYRINT